MRTTIRAAGVCAAIVVALGTGTAGTAQAAPGGLVPAELNGVCGTLFGFGTGVAGLGRTIVSRGAGYAGAIVAAGCLLKDADEAARVYRLSPQGVTEYRALQARYGDYRPDDFLREFGCAEVGVPPVAPDDVSTYGRTTWDCTASPYTNAD
jgi:hypothetical protein